MHVVPLSDLTFISMAAKPLTFQEIQVRQGQTGNSAAKEEALDLHSGEDADGAGDVVESDGEEEGHEEGMPGVECIVDSLGTAMSTKHEEHLDVPAVGYLNSLDIQGRLFSNSREKELVIFVANDAPDQSFVFRVAFGLEVHSFWIPTGWYHKISSQDVFSSTGAKFTDQLQLAPIFPAHAHLPNLLPFFGAFQKAQELSLFNSEAPIQPDGTAIVFLSNITSIVGRNVARWQSRLLFVLTSLSYSSSTYMKEPLPVTGTRFALHFSLKAPETPAASNPIAKSGAPPKRLKVNMRNLWLHVPNTCASVDETDQQEATQALPENFEMTESFTIWKPEDETSMQLFQI
ncbi:hypothetical protein B0H14DRAFT_2565654 [Mycena olivaceomarginata]|nr:hypothetical protein B0H14DRAFT_2565654 [Mycena olivaceomarginata]